MVVTRQFETGSKSGPRAGSKDGPTLTEDRFREIIHEEVVAIFSVKNPDMFGSIKTMMMEFFDDRYPAIVETAAAAASIAVAAVGAGTGQAFQYQDFENTKPLTFDGVQDPIVPRGGYLMLSGVSLRVHVMLTRRLGVL